MRCTPSALQAIKDAVSSATTGRHKTAQEVRVFLLDGLKAIATESGLWISACVHTSGAPRSIDGNDRVYNTHLILDSTGSIKAMYNKIHLFDVSIPGKVELRESNSTAPGTEVVVCDSPVGRLGLSICYDVRFPELYTELVRQGAEVILIPSAFTVPTGRAHWQVLLRSRAIEAQCYVVAAAQYGVHNVKRESYGHSLVVDPWGVVLADVGGVDSPRTVPDSPSVVCCNIDLSLMKDVRQRMPIQTHRGSTKYK
jgi:predicted amidohydrolase